MLEKYKGQIFKFNTEGAAKRFVNHANISLFIVLGCDELYWVTTGRVAGALLKGGYELL